MPRLLQTIAVLICLVAARPSGAFSLLGPAEAWQVPALGYDPLGNDLGAPKNRGEEFRWNTPVITYGFDSSFVQYFGSEGVAAVERAFEILNSLPNLDTLSTNMDEYPLFQPNGSSTTFRDSRRINHRAEANNLVDMKSVALGNLIELLGLASPERWTWALRDRQTVTNPDLTNYLTIQRNFDPATWLPSKYVNGNRYTYQIYEFENPNFADAIEATVDPEHRIHAYGSLANISGGLLGEGLSPGIFYTYLTRDDIGGLRYLYRSDLVHRETFPAGTQTYVVDRTGGLTTITNQDLTLLSLRSLTSPPDLMQAFYPGLIITQALAGVETVRSNVPVVVTNFITQTFSTNYQNPVIVSNIDLFTFSSVTLTSAPAVLTANLQAAFPGVAGFDQLNILSTNFTPTTVVQVASIILTNAPRSPWDIPFVTNFIFQTNYVTNLQTLYRYSFGNVITNYFSPVTRILEIVSGLEREPFSPAQNPIYKTVTNTFLTNFPSGAVTIVPTNLIRFELTDNRATNVFALTNLFFETNFVDLVTGLPRTISQAVYTTFTNVQYFAYPVEILANPFITNTLYTNAFITTNIVVYDYGYGNVITNYAGPNTPATRIRYEVLPHPSNPLLSQTNIIEMEQTVLPVPSGGFIIDTNQTGFEFVTSSSFTVPMTNIVFVATNQAGVRVVEHVVYDFTNTVYLVFPIVLTNAPASALRPGVGELRFERIFQRDGSFLFTNRYSASYYTNGFLTNSVFVNVQAQPDIIIRAADLGTFNDSVRPVQFARGMQFVNNNELNSPGGADIGGPGNIVPFASITFNRVGPSLVNQFPGFVTEASALSEFLLQPFMWGSFDGSTNEPIVFPARTVPLREIEQIMTGATAP